MKASSRNIRRQRRHSTLLPWVWNLKEEVYVGLIFMFHKEVFEEESWDNPEFDN